MKNKKKILIYLLALVLLGISYATDRNIMILGILAAVKIVLRAKK